ncbi:hypothetical protein [Nostoc sp. DSM 114167]
MSKLTIKHPQKENPSIVGIHKKAIAPLNQSAIAIYVYVEVDTWPT